MSDNVEERAPASPSVDCREGGVVLWLLRNPHKWVHRRVETFTFVDDRWARRRISLDCTIPAEIAEQDVSVLGCIPLALLAKRTLRGFDLRDASGRALSLLTTEENSDIAYRTLMSRAEALCGGRVEDGVSDDLRDTVGSAYWPSARALGRMYEAPADEPHQVTAQRRVLMGDPDFESILTELADNFMLLTPRLGTRNPRQIFKYSYEEPLRPEGDLLRRPLVLLRLAGARLGLAGARLVLPVPAARSALSFHCEIEAPLGLEITKARLDRGVSFTPKLGGLGRREKRARRRDAKALNRSLEARDGGGLARAHLQMPRTDLEIGRRPKACVWLRSRRAGFLRPALVTCLLTSTLLVAGHERLTAISLEVEAASTLMLLVPGLLAAYLSRPGEHVMASAALLGVRLMLITSGLRAIAAAALLSAKLSPADLSHAWTLLRSVSVAATVVVLAANLLPIRHSRWVNAGGR